ncbi:MAG: FHA domain-containing protein [Polyangiaceae bacterium]|nr:FHA domain-containing protein [Polyangiaceae bacterium]
MRHSRHWFHALVTLSRLLSALALLALGPLLVVRIAHASPEAHVLRIDPRAAQENGAPVLTSVIEVVQSKRITEAIADCAALSRGAQLDCMSQALDRPYALYQPFPFPEANAVFTVRVNDTDTLAKFVSKARWGDMQQQPGVVGTAWLILIDADSRMGSGFDEAQLLARRFVASMGPNDIANVMFFNDRQVVKDSRWMPASKKNQLGTFIDSVSGTYRAQGRSRSLFTILKNAATDGFKALGNVGESVTVPLHQAMVLLSSGYGGTDPSTTGPGALQLQQYMTQGRFPENNTALPKAPVPVISVYFPLRTWEEFSQNALEFMQNLTNPEIGGFFSVMRDGQGDRADAVVGAVRTRFSKMHVVKWRVSCIAPTVTQTFQLVFNNVNPPILGDSSFKDVPVGIDPSTWPLDIDVQATKDSSSREGGVCPGCAFKVYGNFCWGGNKEQAEVYFLPSGQQLPAALAGTDLDQARRTQQQLIEMGMRGTTLETTDTFAEFEAPDMDKLLWGSGSQALVRLVIYDNKAHRTSGATASSVLELKGKNKPFPLLWVLGGLFGFVVILLLVVAIVRGGSKKPRGAAAPPPAPVVAGGAVPGYAAAPAPAAPPVSPGYAAPAAPQPGGAAAVAAPAQAPAALQEFMYGAGSPAPAAPVPAAGPRPPDPYGPPAGPISRATLQGAAGVFTVVPGVEMRAGRDGSQCAILLGEPRVSGVHATLRIDAGQLWVRDENSNNGSQLNGTRLAPGTWTPVPNGSLIRLGPVEFSVSLE